MKDKIFIFDTTLRDGEQSPGASLNVFEKVEIAKQLAKLKVDIIEAGFPVSSKMQFDAVEQISNSVDVVVAGLARAIEIDIKTAFNALKNAKKFRIHTFIGTSDIHILGKFADSKYGLNLSEKRKNVINMACDAVKFAKTFTSDIEFSPEDAGRTDQSFLNEVIEAVISAGATTVNIPDTTGYTMPEEFGKKIAQLKSGVKNISNAVISVHCHNDLGLAVANSLNAISNGARQIECTINGIGERAGNASLEEIVMALKVRSNYWNFKTDIFTEEIFNTSKMVSSFTGMPVQPNKAIVGENAFAHESGIHQDGMLKRRDTYEIMDPESVGIQKSKIVLGRHSGRHGLSSRLKSLGYEFSDEQLVHLYEKFVELADKKKEIFDDDLRALMGDEAENTFGKYELDYLHVILGTKTIPTATIRIKFDEKVHEESATGDGPIDATFKAINRTIGLDEEIFLENYHVRSITSGKNAQGEVNIRLRIFNDSFSGKGISTDTIEASAKAYLQALNHFEEMKKNKSNLNLDPNI